MPAKAFVSGWHDFCQRRDHVDVSGSTFIPQQLRPVRSRPQGFIATAFPDEGTNEGTIRSPNVSFLCPFVPLVSAQLLDSS